MESVGVVLIPNEDHVAEEMHEYAADFLHLLQTTEALCHLDLPKQLQGLVWQNEHADWSGNEHADFRGAQYI